MEYTLKELLEVQKKVDAGITHNGEYNPKFAINAELVEMMDWLGLVKTWAGEQVIDEKQAFMELVDVFAFSMSWFNQESNNKYMPKVGCVIISPSYNPINGLMYAIGDNNPSGTFEWITAVCHYTFQRPLQDVFYYYMGKQELTKFRQRNGYKTGDYVKIWAGLEDNEHLTMMLENGVDIEQLPETLESAYNTAVKHA